MGTIGGAIGRTARLLRPAGHCGRCAVRGSAPATAGLSLAWRKKGPLSCVLAVQVKGGRPGKGTMVDTALGSSQRLRGRALTVLN